MLMGENWNAWAAKSSNRNGLNTKQLKINGFAISDNYETVDLYISLFYDTENITRVPKADIDQAEKRITNFSE